MDITTAIQYGLEGNAILFTGSGFSYGATNITDNEFITGLALRDYLANECGIASTQSSLSSVSDYHIKHHKSAQPLIETLTRLFTVKTITQSHKTVMSIDWKRIYTTNYDEIVETAATQNNHSVKPVTLSSECNNPAIQKVCVHINGHINNLTENTILKEFKLSDTSYDSEILRGKPWFDFMEKDFLSAKAIIIIGFSLNSDIDISRILSVPSIFQKIIFINKPNMDPIDKNILEKYAPVFEIGIDQFATQIEKIAKDYVSSALPQTQFESFIHEHMCPDSPDSTTLQNLTHFYTLGKISNCIFSTNTCGDFKYIAPRKALNLLIRNLHSKKVFLATSALGNGKTVFCNMVRHELNKIDINIYTYSSSLVDIEYEISEICSNKKKSIIIIDDYYKHLDILNSFYINGCNNVTFLLTSRQSKLATNYRKLINALHINETDIQPLFLYTLVEDEPQKLAEIITNNKLLPENHADKNINSLAQYFSNTCHNLISNIILDLYNSSSIRQKLTDLIDDAIKEEDSSIHDLCILALSSSVMNLDLSFSDMLSLLGIDYIHLSYRYSTLLNELFTVKDDRIEITSSIISKSLLYSIIPPSDLMGILLKVVTLADKLYNHDTKYNELLKAILSHTNFEPLIKANPQNLIHINKFYDQIRNYSFCKNNPFYWEQFATICIQAKDFVTAQQCINSAYSAAKKISGFTPFQIATIHGELLLKQLLFNISCQKVNSVQCIDTIKETHELFMKYYSHPENNHYHIFSCTQHYIEVYDFIQDTIAQRELMIYVEKMTDVSKKMAAYQNSSESSLYPSTSHWSSKINKSLEDAKFRLSTLSKK